jgi:hypothetical protein
VLSVLVIVKGQPWRGALEPTDRQVERLLDDARVETLNGGEVQVTLVLEGAGKPER